jgi:hypothetical protein
MTLVSYENKLIGVSTLGTVVVLFGLALFEMRSGIFGEWVYVLAYLFWVIIAYAIPQALLLRRNGSESRVSRMGVITLMLVIIAVMFSSDVSGIESTVLWGIVGISVTMIFVYEAWRGYQDSTVNEIRGESERSL